jgi:hypothetical protein
MVTELQFIAVAAFLIWGLVASLCGVLMAAPDAAQLVWRHRGGEPEAPMPEHDQPTAVLVSDHTAAASARPSIDPSLEAQAT